MFRTGIGYDSHRFAEGRRLVLGGVEIPSEKGLLGHSDADALLHAIIDALFGAAADGDIGSHFSDKDPRWKDADSRMLLRSAGARVCELGWRVCNVDASVQCERPKLAPFIPQMRRTIAAELGIAPEAVSVKAKTNEGMDATGRGEGVFVLATVLIEKD